MAVVGSLKRYYGPADAPGERTSFASGFDVLRLVLSLFILFLHVRWLGRTTAMAAQFMTVGTAGGLEIRSLSKTVAAFAVPMFFSLSGYLVTGSADRTRDAGKFLFFRVIRIIPALCVEVFLSALVLGPIFTILPLWAYFNDPQFYRYFLNIVGHVTLLLPGVFASNPVPFKVNANLWTLPAEFYCYVCMIFCMLSGLVYRRKVFSIFFLLTTIALFIGYLRFGIILQSENCTIIFLVYFFLTGVLFYLWRDVIPMRRDAALACLVIAALCICINAIVIFAPPFLVYMTVYIGRLRLPYPEFLRKNDYSYGIYLYGFPITQALIAAFPTLVAHHIALRLLSFGLTFAFAAASWHLVERHALKLKKVFIVAPRPSLDITPAGTGQPSLTPQNSAR